MPDTHVTLAPQHPLASFDHSVTINGLASGETLTGSPAVSVQSGMTVGASPAPVVAGTDSNVVVFWLSGGTSGRKYEGEILCGTSAGRTVVVTFDVLVYDRAPNA